MHWLDDRMGRCYAVTARPDRPSRLGRVVRLLLTGLLSALAGCGVVLLAEGVK